MKHIDRQRARGRATSRYIEGKHIDQRVQAAREQAIIRYVYAKRG